MAATITALAALAFPVSAEDGSFQRLALETVGICGNSMLPLSARRNAVTAAGWIELDPASRESVAEAVAEGAVALSWPIARKANDNPLAKEVKRRKHLASFTTGMFGGIGWYEAKAGKKTAYLFLQPYAYPKPISLVACEMVFPESIDVVEYADAKGGWTDFERGPLGDAKAILSSNPHALTLVQQSIGPKRFLKATGKATGFRTYLNASIFSLVNEP